MRALGIAATGMLAQQRNVEVVSNNLANMNTTGFMRRRSEFQDLLYETMQPPGGSTSENTQAPTGIQLGHGVRPVAVAKNFVEGELQMTKNELDLAIEGNGFFQVTLPNGTTAYTRAGAFKLDKEGRS
jgi:flagellar basal-body rod protein FlgG